MITISTAITSNSPAAMPTTMAIGKSLPSSSVVAVVGLPSFSVACKVPISEIDSILNKH